jgi:hypothetical protein
VRMGNTVPALTNNRKLGIVNVSELVPSTFSPN